MSEEHKAPLGAFVERQSDAELNNNNSSENHFSSTSDIWLQ